MIRSIRRRVLVTRLRSVLFIFLTLVIRRDLDHDRRRPGRRKPLGNGQGSQRRRHARCRRVTVDQHRARHDVPDGHRRPGAVLVSQARRLAATTSRSSSTGFKPQKRTGVAVDADSALQINVTLELGEQSEEVTVVGQRDSRRHRLHSARRGRALHDDDDVVAERPQLHGPAGDSARRHSDHDDSGQQRDHGGRHRAGGPIRRAQPRHRVGERPARNRERLLRQRRRRAGADERRHGRRAEPRLDRRVPRC